MGSAEEWLAERGVSMKYVSLVLLIVQTTSLVTSIRFSRVVVQDGPRYLASAAVLWMEIVKLAAALLVILLQKKGEFVHVLRNEVCSSGLELAKLAVPSLLYVVQNNLLYLAIANLDGPTYQVTYNAKIITTGVFSVLLLSKKLSLVQWTALVTLMIGVSTIQFGTADAVDQGGSRVVGLIAVAIACVTSGFSGVYFEMVLKSSNASLWVRNVQMSLSSVPLALLSVWWTDGAKVAEHGLNAGFTPMVWQIVLNQALGGLLVALVIRYADNLLKVFSSWQFVSFWSQFFCFQAFAAALSVISSSILAAVFFDFQISVSFVVGSTLVLVATYVYSSPDVVAAYLPSFLQERKPVLPS